MTLRTALRRSPWITFGLLLAALWILLTWTQLFGALDLTNAGTVGQGALSGVIGLVVLAVTLVFLVVLFGEISESEPSPEPWPPNE